jgi:electron transfer flavoprotein alpha subunit
MAAPVFAFAEARGGAPRKVALEAVCAARRAADALGGGEVHALLIGAPGIAGHAGLLGRHGADRVFVVELAELDRYSPEVYAATAAARFKAATYRAGIFPASAQGRDLAPRVAALLDTSLAADVTGFELGADKLSARHPMYIGKLIATLRLDGPLALLSLRPGAEPVRESAREAQVETVAPALEPSAARVVVTGVAERGGGQVDLGEARVIVSGGRGLRAAEHFALVEQLAAAFGDAAVGATRAVTDDGWRPATDQIGQTGRLVSPELYVAVGISGAVQHLAGMRTSRVIVAINKDRDAPIMKLADYAVVGDLFEVLPPLTEAVRRARAEQG